MGVVDPSGIVWDEIVGFLITMLGATGSWQTLWSGFLLFRLFDVLKPWPIRQIERSLRGGLGIMLDDAMAACYALAILLILRYVGAVH
jgi:phosphatidylglycerophosphatase A